MHHCRTVSHTYAHCPMHTQTAASATDESVTPDAPAETSEARRVRRRAELERSGFNASEWARKNGFNCSIVHAVMTGARKGRYGQAHRIAVLLGFKDGELEPAADLA